MYTNKWEFLVKIYRDIGKKFEVKQGITIEY